MKKKILSLLSVAILFSITVFSTSCKKEAQYTVKTDKTTYHGGGTVVVTYTADAKCDKHAWVGIVPSKIEHGKEYINDAHDLTYEYLNNRAEGKVEFTVPKEPGKYDIRLNDTDSGAADGTTGKEVSSVTFSGE